jgi:predicted transcriptional regulator
LYAGVSLPDKPITKKHLSKAERNADIIALHQAGENLSEIAREYGISPQRAHQIVTGKLIQRISPATPPRHTILIPGFDWSTPSLEGASQLCALLKNQCHSSLCREAVQVAELAA